LVFAPWMSTPTASTKMGACASKPADDGGDGAGSGNPGRKIKRTKSITVDANRMRRTKSAVYDPEVEGQTESAEKLTRRTSTVGASSMGKPAAAQETAKAPPADQAKITVGVFTHVGDPDVHPNEDRATAVLDLLGKFPPAGKEYKGDENKMVSFFGVYDGHGGSSCSEWLRKNLHIEVVKRLFVANTDAELPAQVSQCFDETERDFCGKFAPGSCCVTTMVKGRKIYCADCGDSMAVVYDGTKGKMTKLNDRHGVEFSKKEIQRLRSVKADISTDYETEGAVISRDSRGRFVKALYPTRGFGDADFKELVTAACIAKNRPESEHEVVIATPTGAGLGYEGPAYEMKGKGPYWLMLGCDGLWDFMKEDQITKAMFSKDTPQAMAEHLVKVAQAPPYSSYDDVTIVVCKIEFD